MNPPPAPMHRPGSSPPRTLTATFPFTFTGPLPVALALLFASTAALRAADRSWSDRPYQPDWAQKPNPSILSDAQWRAIGEYRSNLYEEEDRWRQKLGAELDAVKERQRLASAAKNAGIAEGNRQAAVFREKYEKRDAAFRAGDEQTILTGIREHLADKRTSPAGELPPLFTFYTGKLGAALRSIKNPSLALRPWQGLWATTLSAFHDDIPDVFLSSEDVLGDSPLALQHSLAVFCAAAGHSLPADATELAAQRREFAAAISAAMLNSLAAAPPAAPGAPFPRLPVALAALARRAHRNNPDVAPNPAALAVIDRARTSPSTGEFDLHFVVRAGAAPTHAPRADRAVNAIDLEAFRALAAIQLSGPGKNLELLRRLRPDGPARPAWLDDRPTNSAFKWCVDLRIRQDQADTAHYSAKLLADYGVRPLQEMLRRNLDLVVAPPAPDTLEKLRRWSATLAAFRRDPAAHALRLLLDSGEGSPDSYVAYDDALAILPRLDAEKFSDPDTAHLEQLARRHPHLLTAPALRITAAYRLRAPGPNSELADSDRTVLTTLIGATADPALNSTQRARRLEILGERLGQHRAAADGLLAEAAATPTLDDACAFADLALRYRTAELTAGSALSPARAESLLAQFHREIGDLAGDKARHFSRSTPNLIIPYTIEALRRTGTPFTPAAAAPAEKSAPLAALADFARAESAASYHHNAGLELLGREVIRTQAAPDAVAALFARATAKPLWWGPNEWTAGDPVDFGRWELRLTRRLRAEALAAHLLARRTPLAASSGQTDHDLRSLLHTLADDRPVLDWPLAGRDLAVGGLATRALLDFERAHPGAQPNESNFPAWLARVDQLPAALPPGEMIALLATAAAGDPGKNLRPSTAAASALAAAAEPALASEPDFAGTRATRELALESLARLIGRFPPDDTWPAGLPALHRADFLRARVLWEQSRAAAPDATPADRARQLTGHAKLLLAAAKLGPRAAALAFAARVDPKNPVFRQLYHEPDPEFAPALLRAASETDVPDRAKLLARLEAGDSPETPTHWLALLAGKNWPASQP
ncbi:MAG: hypothetical protein RLZZ15_2413 [Verrucomicrobiota bacterium]